MSKAEKLNQTILWSDFADNFFYFVEVGCEHFLDYYNQVDGSNENDKTELNFRFCSLYIPIIFNIKHGLELSLKCLIRTLDEKNEKNIYTHNLEVNFYSFENIVKEKKDIKSFVLGLKSDSYYFDLKYKAEKFEETISCFKILVFKYHNLEFIKNKKLKASLQNDNFNEFFRFPENKKNKKIDYFNLVYGENFETRDDVFNSFHEDVKKIKLIVRDLSDIFRIYIEEKK